MKEKAHQPSPIRGAFLLVALALVFLAFLKTLAFQASFLSRLDTAFLSGLLYEAGIACLLIVLYGMWKGRKWTLPFWSIVTGISVIFTIGLAVRSSLEIPGHYWESVWYAISHTDPLFLSFYLITLVMPLAIEAWLLASRPSVK